LVHLAAIKHFLLFFYIYIKEKKIIIIREKIFMSCLLQHNFFKIIYLIEDAGRLPMVLCIPTLVPSRTIDWYIYSRGGKKTQDLDPK
jgi:hypothetical protein